MCQHSIKVGRHSDGGVVRLRSAGRSFSGSDLAPRKKAVDPIPMLPGGLLCLNGWGGEAAVNVSGAINGEASLAVVRPKR